MNKIIIVASELSVMTGHKNFNEKDKLKVINLILNRNGIVKKYIPKSKIEEQLLNLSEKDLNCIKKELNIDDKSSLNDIENMIKKQVLSKSLNKNITEDQSKKRMNDVIKSMPTLNKYLEKDIKQDLRMERGNIKENKNLDKTQIKCNIKIDNRRSSIIISGPNSGGKTVVIKSIGLYAVMAQCGLYIPSRVAMLPIFKSFLSDIGDKQSLNDDLSTFSAHMKEISNILNVSDEFSLVIIDEMGTGTDPDIGASLSIVICKD